MAYSNRQLQFAFLERARFRAVLFHIYQRIGLPAADHRDAQRQRAGLNGRIPDGADP